MHLNLSAQQSWQAAISPPMVLLRCTFVLSNSAEYFRKENFTFNRLCRYPRPGLGGDLPHVHLQLTVGRRWVDATTQRNYDVFTRH